MNDLLSMVNDDAEALRQLGPATIRAFGGPEAIAGLLASIAMRESSAQTQLKALAIAGQWIKTSAEISGDDTDEMSDEELEKELAKLAKQDASARE